MMGKKSGVSTQVLAGQPKDVAIHCQGHSLNLSVKLMTKKCDILHHVMSVVGEIFILVKFSSKREHLLGNISDDIEKEDSDMFKKLKKLSATGWTVCVECMKRFIDNCESLLQFWNKCLKAIKGKKCSDLVIDILRSMRNDEDFDSFFEVVKKAADPVKPVGKPTLPRKQKKAKLFYPAIRYWLRRAREQCLSPGNSPRLFQANVFSSS